MTDIRRIVRWVVNILSLVVAVLALPELVAILPPSALAAVAVAMPILNMLLSWLRPLAPSAYR